MKRKIISLIVVFSMLLACIGSLNLQAAEQYLITGASLMLGEKLGIIFYTDIPYSSDKIATIELNDRESAVVPKSKNGCAAYEFKEIVPNEMRAPITIKAENINLSVSFMDIVIMMLDSDGYEDECYALLSNLVEYGYACEWFTSGTANYAEIESFLANPPAHYTADLYNINETPSSDKAVEVAADTSAYLYSVGYFFSDYNRLCVKFYAERPTEVNIVIGGRTYSEDDFNEEGSRIYSVYSYPISAKNLGDTVSVKLVHGDNVQRLLYSTKAYASSVMSSDQYNELDKYLVYYLYRYSVAAANYVEIAGSWNETYDDTPGEESNESEIEEDDVILIETFSGLYLPYLVLEINNNKANLLCLTAIGESQFSENECIYENNALDQGLNEVYEEWAIADSFKNAIVPRVIHQEMWQQVQQGSVYDYSYTVPSWQSEMGEDYTVYFSQVDDISEPIERYFYASPLSDWINWAFRQHGGGCYFDMQDICNVQQWDYNVVFNMQAGVYDIIEPAAGLLPWSSSVFTFTDYGYTANDEIYYYDVYRAIQAGSTLPADNNAPIQFGVTVDLTKLEYEKVTKTRTRLIHNLPIMFDVYEGASWATIGLSTSYPLCQLGYLAVAPDDTLYLLGTPITEYDSDGETIIGNVSLFGEINLSHYYVVDLPTANAMCFEYDNYSCCLCNGNYSSVNIVFDPVNAFEYVAFTSSNPDVASIDRCYTNGCQILLNSVGTTTITAISESGLTAECTVEVKYPETITEGEIKTAIINNPGEYMYFEFTPEEDGYYLFGSGTEYDTYGYIYNSDMTIIAYDDDSGENNNFLVGCYMTAGTQYILGARYYGNNITGPFDVGVYRYSD